MIRHRSQNPNWGMKQFGHLKAHVRKVYRSIGRLADTRSVALLTASFEFVGLPLGPKQRY
jgi:hypothetical protein